MANTLHLVETPYTWWELATLGGELTTLGWEVATLGGEHPTLGGKHSTLGWNTLLLVGN